MTLDLGAISRQITQLGGMLLERRTEERERLHAALSLLSAPIDVDALAAKVATARTGWRPALPIEPLSLHQPAPALPPSLSVLASDGSSVEPDRHGVALCYLINIGLVALHYGEQPGALLHNEPYLGFRDEDLYIAAGGQQVLVSGPLLTIRRQTLESERLAALAASLPAGRPAVALQDGTLVLGTLEGSGLEQWLREGPLKALLARYGDLKARRLPLAAYASRPRHGEVVNALRVLVCPQSSPDCQHGCTARGGVDGKAAALCNLLGKLADRALFGAILEPGERSALCRSQWAISLSHYGEHRVHFFYLNVGPEIGRVEVPEWVARDRALLGLVQAAVVDQCERGRGYPTALLEAHEQAVLRGPDRRQFEEMLDTALVRAGLPLATSEKERGKRLRAL